MNVALWVVAGLLAAIFLLAGAMKMMKSKEDLLEQMGWVEEYDERTLKVIGFLEVLAAIGLIVPAITDFVPSLVPLAALGIALTMAGAIAVHQKRGETPQVLMNTAFLVMSLFVAWGRFGDNAF